MKRCMIKNEQNRSKLPIHKNIRKLKSNKVSSECSAYTLAETVTKSVHKSIPFVTELSPIKTKLTSEIISPLKTILKTSSENIRTEVQPLCKYMILEDIPKRQLMEFKLFKEDQVPLITQKITKVSLSDLGYDNDNETDNEQIKNGIKVMEESILKGLKTSKMQINNLYKYRK